MASNIEITEQPSSDKVTNPTGTPLLHIVRPLAVHIWELKPHLTALMNDRNSKFSFIYKPDPLFPTGFLLSNVKRSDGSTTPPYHMQMYNLIRKRCDSE